MSRARHGACLYATSHDAAAIGERAHTTGIRLPSEPDDDPGADLLDALEHSQAKLLASSHRPAPRPHRRPRHRPPPSTELHARHRHVNRRRAPTRTRPDTATRPSNGNGSPPARTHRSFMHVGGRVRALDWDNVGTITAIADHTGTAYVHFVAPDGRQATAARTGAQIKPIDHPDPADLSADAADYFALAEQAIADDVAAWHQHLAAHDIDPDEPAVIPAAIEHRTRQLAHRLAGQQPAWLTWWLGERPAIRPAPRCGTTKSPPSPSGATAHHIHDDIAGYGPPPDDRRPARAVAAEHLRRSHDIHRWLHAPPTRPRSRPRHPSSPPPRSGERLDELDAILATAPPDQTRIIARPPHRRTHPRRPRRRHRPTPSPPKTPAATGSSSTGPTSSNTPNSPASPHTRPARTTGPTRCPPPPNSSYDQLVTITTDTPEPRTLNRPRRRTRRRRPTHPPRATAPRPRHSPTTPPRPQRRTGQPHRTRPGSPTSTVTAPNSPNADATSTTNSPATAPNPACGPQDTGPRAVTDAINRRSQHLAHQAITNADPWVHETVRRWHANHPDGDVHQLHRTVIEIAGVARTQRPHRRRPRRTPPRRRPSRPDGSPMGATSQPARRRDAHRRTLHVAPGEAAVPQVRHLVEAGSEPDPRSAVCAVAAGNRPHPPYRPGRFRGSQAILKAAFRRLSSRQHRVESIEPNVGGAGSRVPLVEAAPVWDGTAGPAARTCQDR